VPLFLLKQAHIKVTLFPSLQESFAKAAEETWWSISEVFAPVHGQKPWVFRVFGG